MIGRLGVGLWTLQSSAARPGNFTALYRRFAEDAALADELGFHSVWIAEHRLWYDGYCPALLHALAPVAACTSRIQLGQAILIAPQHDPAGLAANAATLHELSGGRLALGLGLGHRDAEFDALGVRRDRRGRLMEASLDAVEPVGAPIWMGGMASKMLERAARRGHSLMLPQTLYTNEIAGPLDEYRSYGGAGTIAIMRDAWIEPDERKAALARERIVAHYMEEAGAWWVLKGAVGFENPEQLARQRERILAASVIGSPEHVAERMRADMAAGIDVWALRLSYDFCSQAELREQLHRVAEEVAPLMGAAG